MNKTLRNKALRDSTKLITATLNDEDWCAPDGHFATAYPIYDGYRIKKSQYVPENKPKLDQILPKTDYILAEFVDDLGDVVEVRTSSHDTIYSLNKDFWNLLTNIYPDALPFVDADGYWANPVELHDNGVLVALIMPIRK